MLRRLLRSLGGSDNSPTPGHASYLAEVLSAVDNETRDAAPDTDLDPLVTMGEWITGVEAGRGLDPAPEDPAAREPFLRTYAGLLVENDRLPPALQIGGADLVRPRRLLSAFFGGSKSVQREAQEVLRFIEDRFGSGRFGQARLLLQLFDTDPATQRNNERNLFYEEMILRFMSNRAGRLSTGDVAYGQAVAESMTSRGEGLTRLATWLQRHAGIRLHVLVPHLPDVVVPPGPTDTAAARAVPGLAWRSVAGIERGTLGSCVDRQIERQGLRTYVTEMARTGYFIAHAPGETGFEELLFRFVEWATEHFEGPATRVLPDVHRMSTIEDVHLVQALDAAYTAYLSTSASFGSGHFSPEAVHAALGRVHARFESFDPATLPEGDYDLGGLVFDELARFPSDSLVESFRVHRLT